MLPEQKFHILQRMSLFILSGHKRVSSVATVSWFCVPTLLLLLIAES